MDNINILQPLVALLILSLTTEKVANIIKLWRLPTKTLTETEKEKRYQWISVLVGVSIALIAKADLFGMFTDKNFTFFWENTPISFSNVIGSILTGGFLSFGSQFFHDLLSILFQVKTMKVTLKEKLGQEVENQIKTNEENSKE